MESSQQPTPDQVEGAQQVGGAAAAAAAAESTPESAREAAQQAARTTADNVKLDIPEEAIEAIANGVVSQMELRGAFDAPPEPVMAPPPPAEPTEPPTEPPGPPTEPARKPSLAERFLGG